METHHMNVKRFIPSFIVVFAFIYGFDFVFHGIYMKDAYQATASMWRPQEAMQQFLPWMLGSQALLALMFCYIFTKGYQARGMLEGVRYGILIALLGTSGALMMFAVVPYPGDMVCTWIVAKFIKFIVAGALLALIYRK
jgi:hypothetical protein